VHRARGGFPLALMYSKKTTMAYTTPTPSRPDTWFHNRWVTLSLFALLFLVCYIDRFILGALLTPIKDELRITDEQLGRLNTIFVVAYIGIIPLWGYLGDRFSRKWFILSSLILWSFSSIGSGLAVTFGSLLFWRAFVGLGEGIFSGMAPGWIADTFGPKLRSLAFAIVQSTSQIAAWVAYHYGGKIAAESSWHNALFIAGVPGLILALGVIFLREPKPGAADDEAVQQTAKPTLAETLQFLKDKSYLLYVGAYTIRMLAVSGLFFWGAVLLHREFGVSNKEATSFIGGAYFWAGVPGIFIGGFLAGRLARRLRGAYAFWLVGGEILSGIAVATVLLFVHDLQTAQWLILAQMFFAGNSWGVINPLLFELAPARLRSVAVSVSIAVATGGSTFLYAQLLGYISDLYGIRHALYLIPAGYFIAASLWLALGLRQKRAQEKSEVSVATLETASA